MAGYFIPKKMGDGITAIWELSGVSETLIEGDDRALLMDTGYGIFSLENEVKKLTDKPLTVCNSHLHPDHSNGNHRFPEVMVEKDDIPPADGTPVEVQRLAGGLVDGLEKKAPKLKFAFEFFKDHMLMLRTNDTKYVEVNDGDIIDLGNRVIEFKAVPGHTPGSMVLLDRKTRTIITGDAVNSATWLFTNSGITMSEYINNLRDLALTQGYDRITCSHVPFAVPFSYISDYADFLEHLDISKAKKVNVPGLPEPLCIYQKISLKYGMMGIWFFESQLAKQPETVPGAAPAQA